MRTALVLALVLLGGCGGGEPDRGGRAPTCPVLPAEAVAGEVDVRMALVEASASACSYAALDATSPATVTVRVVAAAAPSAARQGCRGQVERVEVGDEAFACRTPRGGRGVVRAAGTAVVVVVSGVDAPAFEQVLAQALLLRVVVPVPVPGTG